MSSSNKIWIQNSYRSAIELIVRNEQTHEDDHYIFGNYKVDRITGRVLSDGYTEIDKDTYDLLMQKSSAFKRFIGDGTLIMYTEAPLAAMSDVDRILALQEENRVLKEENAKLKAELEASGKTETAASADTDAPKTTKSSGKKTSSK